MATPDTIVVGGGIIGLAAAYELARRGQRVLILERGRTGSGCSSVGGGFCARLSQVNGATAQLVRESQVRYHTLGEELGADLGRRTCGCLMLAAGDEEAAVLHDRRGTTEQPRPWEWIDATAVRELEPLCRESVRGALYAVGDLQVDPRRLLTAYRDALARLSVEIREQQVVIELLRDIRRVSGVRTRYGVLEAGVVLLASGCWTPALLPHTHAALVRPRRGQLLLAMPRRRSYQHLLLGADYYLAKQGGSDLGFSLEQTVDGVIKLGGSREWAGYDSRPSRILCRVEENARRYVELPEGLTWSHAVAGLRPATADGMPLLGQLERGLWLAVGHEGNGFATAPATATRLAAAVCGEPADLRAFNPGRFMTPPEGQPGSSTRLGGQTRGAAPSG